MPQQLKARYVGVLLAMLGVLTLAGCASNTPIEHFSGVPQVQAEDGTAEDVDVPEGETTAVYLDNGDRLAVVMWGSSTCPPVGSQLVVVKDAHSGNAVRLDVAEIPADSVCTADLVPHTTVFGTPQQISTTQPLKIDVNGEEVVLPVK